MTISPQFQPLPRLFILYYDDERGGEMKYEMGELNEFK